MPVTKTLQDVGGGSTAELGANWRMQFVQPDGLPLTMAGLEEIDFGAISFKEIFQNVKTILATPLFSAALERTLGLDQTIVDRPISEAALVTVAILDAVTTWEPRHHVRNIDFEADAINGHLVPILQLDIKNVIYGTNTPYGQTSIFQAPTSVDQSLPPMQQPVLIPGPPGPIGATGLTGAVGPRGSLWIIDTVDPTSSNKIPADVQPNDVFLNSLTGAVFQYDGTMWSVFGRFTET